MLMSSTLRGAVLVLLGALAAPSAFAADAWTEEGGNASGNSLNADQTILGADDLDQMIWLWSRFELTPYTTLSPPVASDGQAFVNRFVDAPTHAAHTNLFGLDARSGATLWEVEMKGASSSPALTMSLVIVSRNFDFGCTVEAHDRATGERVWQTHLAGSGTASAPHVLDGVVYLTTGDSVFALDAATGAQLWDTYVGFADGATRAPVADGVVLVSQLDGLLALDAKDGHTLWHATGVFSTQPQIIVNGTALVQDSKGLVHAFDLATGSPRWVSSPGHADSKRVMTPLSTDGQRVFAVVGSFEMSVTAFDLATGATLWSRDSLGELESPVVSNGVLYLARPHDIAAFDATTGRRLPHSNLPGYEYGRLSLAEGRLFLITGKHLYALGIPQGEVAGTAETSR